MHLFIFKQSPQQGAWDLTKTLTLDEYDTPAVYRANFYEAVGVWLVEAESESEAWGTLTFYELLPLRAS